MTKPTVYLCGPINGCTDEEAEGWRREATEKLSPIYDVLDPMTRDYRGIGAGNESEIVLGDQADIDIADAVLVNALRPSWGTAMEVFYAYEEGKPVIAFVGHQRPSPWLKYHCEYVFPTLQDCVTALLTGKR